MRDPAFSYGRVATRDSEPGLRQRKGFLFTMATTVISIIQVLVGAVLIIFVLGQSGKHSGLGMISGATDSFLSKNKARTADAKLAKWTKWVALVFIVLTLVLNFL